MLLKYGEVQIQVSEVQPVEPGTKFVDQWGNVIGTVISSHVKDNAVYADIHIRPVVVSPEPDPQPIIVEGN